MNIFSVNKIIKEAKKVSWIGKRELMISTSMVLIIVVISSLFFVLTDFVIAKTIRMLLGFGG